MVYHVSLPMHQVRRRIFLLLPLLPLSSSYCFPFLLASSAAAVSRMNVDQDVLRVVDTIIQYCLWLVDCNRNWFAPLLRLATEGVCPPVNTGLSMVIWSSFTCFLLLVIAVVELIICSPLLGFGVTSVSMGFFLIFSGIGFMMNMLLAATLSRDASRLASPNTYPLLVTCAVALGLVFVLLSLPSHLFFALKRFRAIQLRWVVTGLLSLFGCIASGVLLADSLRVVTSCGQRTACSVCIEETVISELWVAILTAMNVILFLCLLFAAIWRLWRPEPLDPEKWTGQVEEDFALHSFQVSSAGPVAAVPVQFQSSSTPLVEEQNSQEENPAFKKSVSVLEPL